MLTKLPYSGLPTDLSAPLPEVFFQSPVAHTLATHDLMAQFATSLLTPPGATGTPLLLEQICRRFSQTDPYQVATAHGKTWDSPRLVPDLDIWDTVFSQKRTPAKPDAGQFRPRLDRLENNLKRWEGNADPSRPEDPDLIKQIFRDATALFSEYVHYRTSGLRETVIGREDLVQLIHLALRGGQPLPYQIAIRLPITSWNNKGGNAAADIIMDAALSVIFRHFHQRPQQTGLMRRTLIGIQIAHEDYHLFGEQQLFNLQRSFPTLLEKELRDLLFDRTGTAPVRENPDGNLEIRTEDGDWIAYADFSKDVFGGVQQVTLPAIKDAGSLENRARIERSAIEARDRAITLAEGLADAAKSAAGAVASFKTSTESGPIAARDFPQGIFTLPDQILEILIRFSYRDEVLLWDMLTDLNFSASDTAFLLEELRALRAADPSQKEPSVALNNACLKIYDAFGDEATDTLSLFALKAGLIPRLTHELSSFTGVVTRPDNKKVPGALGYFATRFKAVRQPHQDEEQRTHYRYQTVLHNPPAGAAKTELIAELRRLLSQAKRARYELTNALAVKEAFFEEEALRLFQDVSAKHSGLTGAATVPFHVLAIDIDHLRSYFAAYPVKPGQLVDQDMITLQRLPQRALANYARELRLPIPEVTLKFGDEIIMTFPARLTTADGGAVAVDFNRYEEILRGELEKAYGNKMFPLAKKAAVGGELKRLPLFELEFSNGSTVQVLSLAAGKTFQPGTEFLLPAGEQETAWRGSLNDFIRTRFPGAELKAARAVSGKMGFTIAATQYHFMLHQWVTFTRNDVEQLRKALLKRVSAEKDRGRRNQSWQGPQEEILSLTTEAYAISASLLRDGVAWMLGA